MRHEIPMTGLYEPIWRLNFGVFGWLFRREVLPCPAHGPALRVTLWEARSVSQATPKSSCLLIPSTVPIFARSSGLGIARRMSNKPLRVGNYPGSSTR